MYRNVSIHPEAITTEGLLIFRFASALIFFNANYFRTSLKQKIREAQTPVKMVLIDAETINMIDSTALEMLEKLQSELAKQNIILSWARLRDQVYLQMSKTGLNDQIGEDNFYERISDAVTQFISQNRDN